jgi:hypothetical protein
MTEVLNRPSPVQDKSLFVKQSALNDAPPPREPFVGEVKDWGFQAGSVQDQQTGQVKATNAFVLTIDPLTTAVDSQDGLLRDFTSHSTRATSTYGIKLAQINSSLSQINGIPGYELTDPDELVGKKFVFGEVAPTDPMWAPLGNYKPKRNVLVVLGPAPAGWEASIPANLAELKAAGMAKWQQKHASQQAGQPLGPAPSFLGTGNAMGTTGINATNGVAGVTMSADEETAILAFLPGKSHENLPIDVAGNAAFKAAVRPEIYAGLFDKSIPTRLIDEGKLAEENGTYRLPG